MKHIDIFANPLEILRRCGGFYDFVLDNPKGLLVGYAAKYDAPDGTRKQWVGRTYANFVKAEERPIVMQTFACQLHERLADFPPIQFDILCGAPIGGYVFSQMLGLTFPQALVVKAEKKTVALATETQREQSKIVFARHSVERGARYVVVEDVCNNFSTTEDLIGAVKEGGGMVVAIFCLLNRSLTVDALYQSMAGKNVIPVVSLVRMPIPEFKQEDPDVADLISQSRVIFKPKDEWDRLMAAMDAKQV